MPLLTVRGLRTGLIGPLSVALDAGECAVVFGSSGAGKTRLLRAIADLDPHEGEVELDGQSCSMMAAPHWRRRVAMLPAEPQWWLDCAVDHFSESAPEPTDLEALGLTTHQLRQPVAELSEGQRQRLAILRLLVNRPQILLLDEPTARLDEKNVRKVEALLSDYLRWRPAAMIWVTHDPAQGVRIGQRFWCVEHGRLVEMPEWPASW